MVWIQILQVRNQVSGDLSNFQQRGSIKDMIESTGVAPKSGIMIGDTDADIRGAQSLGMPTCAVTYGVRDAERLEPLNADYTVHDPERLLDCVR